MDVYLVPVGPQRYELYCEIPDEPADAGSDEPRGFFRRLYHRFHLTIADAERERRHGIPADVRRGRFGRMQARMLRWVAESIAEQRLLWHLRQQDAACLHYPDDVNEQDAAGILRQQLGRDAEKHRRWLIIDGIAFVV